MNKEWVEKKNADRNKWLVEMEQRIRNEIEMATFLTENVKNRMLSSLDKLKKNGSSCEFRFEMQSGYLDLDSDDIKVASISYEEYREWLKKLEVETFCSNMQYTNIYNRYLDSEPKEFDGDIIITDPCYIIRAEHHGTKPLTKDDWATCEYGENMEALGIHTYMTRGTLYGDWSCTTYNSDTKEPIGEFCADAGLVSVFLLDEVLKYNPDFDYHINKLWTTTLIKDFKGTVQFVVIHTEGVYDDETKYHKKGEKWEDYSVEVVGHGINKVTNELINFVGTQTGF